MFFQPPPLPPERPAIVAPIFSAASTTFVKVTDYEVKVIDPDSTDRVAPKRTHIQSRADKKPVLMKIVIPLKVVRAGR